MRAVFEKRPVPPGCSFRFFQHQSAAFSFHWHFQADYELVLITRGRGQRFIGDHVGSFRSGDLVLVGPHLPHTWVSDPGRNPGGCATIYLQFDRECL
jgi:hypothetical protein